ncbi:hypothetical protein [Hymenobacter swuensis]|uniref:Uncharacterized protein n=1 Tax=Hymenobacter swuensis DY53 TaxID=1227739 RepID=W8EWJ6_9BACT|nr:hypothetical protein [Hymenobacter swuensis]AHJ96162.1 hypothetical protein Hsw_0567 [Hymenobacter swuensis DY53]
MKTIIPIVLLLGATNASLAQTITLVPVAPDAAVAAPVRPLSDSTRQAVHKLFKWGRLYGLISTVSGGLVLGSSTGYAIGGDTNWKNLGSIAMGGTALALGTTSLVRFSRRRERAVLAALERGETLPPYVMLMSPFLPKK